MRFIHCCYWDEREVHNSDEFELWLSIEYRHLFERSNNSVICDLNSYNLLFKYHEINHWCQLLCLNNFERVWTSLNGFVGTHLTSIVKTSYIPKIFLVLVGRSITSTYSTTDTRCSSITASILVIRSKSCWCVFESHDWALFWWWSKDDDGVSKSARLT